jgi:hypothetical protein
MRMWRSLVSKFQFVLQVLLVFAVARVIAGLIMIIFFERDSVAWSYGLTVLLAAGLALCIVAALAVRRWSPPRPRAR